MRAAVLSKVQDILRISLHALQTLLILIEMHTKHLQTSESVDQSDPPDKQSKRNKSTRSERENFYSQTMIKKTNIHIPEAIDIDI